VDLVDGRRDGGRVASGDDACDNQQLSVAIDHLHWAPPLIVIVYSRLDRGIQSATEM